MILMMTTTTTTTMRMNDSLSLRVISLHIIAGWLGTLTLP
jgi:ammonia channel protein AmtB